MPVLDTSELIERLKRGEEVADDKTVVSLVEYPKASGHPLFKGSVLFPKVEDYITAFNIQCELLRIERPKSFSDLIVAAICINRGEKLITRDKDFTDIARVSGLNVEIIQ